MIADLYLIVRQWRPNFDPDSIAINKVAVWAQIPNLPIMYYDKLFLTRIGNRLGMTIRVDGTT